MVRILFLVLFSSFALADLQYLSKSIVTQTVFENVTNSFSRDTTTTNSNDDAVDDNVPIGFSFPFNGTTYSSVNIDSNGHLAFVNIGSKYVNESLASNTRTQAIYPYWDDLNPASGGSITYGTLGSGESEYFVISWNSVPHYPSLGAYSFQVILYKNGDIRFRYNASSSVDGTSGTIGVQENTTNYDQHSYNSSSTFDATKDILYESLLTSLTAVTPSCTTPSSQIKMTTYSTTGYNSYPADTSAFSTLVQSYATDANLFGSGYLNQINGTGNPYGSDEHYLTVFEGYIYLPTTGVYAFGVDGDDAIEVYLDDTLITGWYGGHGRASQARNVVNVFAQTGWHKLKYHHQERTGGDSYYLYWKQPNGSLEMVPSTQLFHCDNGAKMSMTKSSCVIEDLVNGTVQPKRIPGATIRYALEVSNEGTSTATNVLLNDSLSSKFDETSIKNLQVQSGACDCLGVSSASNNGVSGTADGVNPIVLDFGDVLGGSVTTPTKECGYFEVALR